MQNKKKKENQGALLKERDDDVLDFF